MVFPHQDNPRAYSLMSVATGLLFPQGLHQHDNFRFRKGPQTTVLSDGVQPTSIYIHMARASIGSLFGTGEHPVEAELARQKFLPIPVQTNVPLMTTSRLRTSKSTGVIKDALGPPSVSSEVIVPHPARPLSSKALGKRRAVADDDPSANAPHPRPKKKAKEADEMSHSQKGAKPEEATKRRVLPVRQRRGAQGIGNSAVDEMILERYQRSGQYALFCQLQSN